MSVGDMAKAMRFLHDARRWRDAALVGLLYDTGMRASEVANLRTDDIDLEHGVAVIRHTKGKRVRRVSFSDECARLLDRYWRRARKDPEWAFNGTKGKMRRDGIYDVVTRVFRDAGVPGVISPHDLRHTSASHVAAKMGESDMMALYGWEDAAMARHYTRQVRAELALKAHKSASPLKALGS